MSGICVIYNSPVNSFFKFTIRSKWSKNNPKPIVIRFLRFAIYEKINESCDTERDTLGMMMMMMKYS